MLSVSPRGLILRNPHALGNNSHNYTRALNFALILEVPANLLPGKSNPCNGLASNSIQFFFYTTGYLSAFCKVKY